MHNLVCKGEMNAHFKTINVHLMNIGTAPKRCTSVTEHCKLVRCSNDNVRVCWHQESRHFIMLYNACNTGCEKGEMLGTQCD